MDATLDRVVTLLAGARKGDTDASIELAALLLLLDDDAGLGSQTERILAEADPVAWRHLEQRCRGSWDRVAGWPIAAERRLRADRIGTLGLVVASFHPSGFVREGAVRRLAGTHGPSAARALAIRTADWVFEVAVAARAALRPRLASAAGLAAVAGLAHVLRDRREGAWLAGQILPSLAALDSDDLALVRADDDWRTRRAAYEASIETGRLSIGELVTAVRSQTDLAVRVRCAESALRVAATDGRLDEVIALLDSRVAAVRAMTVHAMARAGRTEIAIRALSDPATSVREVAQGAVRRAGGDPAQHYRRRLAEAVEPSLLRGLGESGMPSDAQLVTPTLDDARPGVRAAAIHALRLLGSADPLRMLEMLNDPSGAVVSEAATLLLPDATALPVATLRGFLSTGRPRPTRRAAYLLLHACDAVTRVQTDLDVLADPDDPLHERASQDLWGWVDNGSATGYTSPTPSQAQAMEESIARAGPAIGPDRVRVLRFVLGLPRP